tara:strand:+ start:1995 stop:3143 length:1149 start_codon:yes stop_codon:yes gene_type:complete
MSVGTNLQEMENVVTKGAKPADPQQKGLSISTPGQGSVEDLGGPTPENSRPDDDSNKLKTPGTTLKQVKDIVTKGAKPADPMPTGMKEEENVEGDVVAEDPEVSADDVVSEEETAEVDETQEVVAEEEATEEEVIEEEQIDIEADVQALLEGEELSEEFQEKAKTIFEAAIKSKLADVREAVKTEYEEQLVEEVAAIKSELEERVDAYLEYVADEWLQENQIAVEAGLKTEMTESFLEGMKNLFEEHYVSVPEEKYDVIESMVDKLDEMEGKLNEQIEKNIALNRRLAESTSDVVFGEVAEGLASSQKEKLATLVENVEFESESDYREKLVTLKESYFPSNAGSQRDKSENLSEGTETPENIAEISNTMSAYLQTLNRVSKK